MTFNTDSELLRQLQTDGRKVTLELEGLDGNAFNLMGQFQKQALKQGWTRQEVDAVLDECRSGDYDHLLGTLMEFCESEDQDEDDTDPYD